MNTQLHQQKLEILSRLIKADQLSLAEALLLLQDSGKEEPAAKPGLLPLATEHDIWNQPYPWKWINPPVTMNGNPTTLTPSPVGTTVTYTQNQSLSTFTS